MTEIIQTIINSFGKTLASFLHKVVDTANVIFSYFNKKIDQNIEKEELKKEEKIKETIEKTCDKGTLDDLFDLNKIVKVLLIISMICFSGCISDKIKIQSTKYWEGHFMNEKDFYKSTSNIKLEKGESIWVLSNRSLKRVLIEKQER